MAKSEAKRPREAPEALETVEALRARLGTPGHWFEGAKAGGRWPIGYELTESEYLAAIARAKGVSI